MNVTPIRPCAKPTDKPKEPVIYHGVDLDLAKEHSYEIAVLMANGRIIDVIA